MDYLNISLPAIEGLGGFGYWLVFLIAFAESIAFIGTILPGTTLIVVAGFLAARGDFNIVALIWFAVAGAVLGDGLSYFLGTRGKNFFNNENKLLKLSHLEKGEEFFKEHGPKSVFLGRFVGFIRPVIPFVAGLSRMKVRVFLFWNISSAFLWAVFYLLLGYFFGGAIDIIKTWATRAGLIIISIAAVAAVLWLVLRKSELIIAASKSVFTLLNERFISGPAGRFAEKNPQLTGFVKERFGREHFSGVPLTLFSIAFVYVIFLFFGSVQNALSSSTVALLDQRVADLLFSFRDSDLVRFFTWVSLLAKWQAIFALAIVVTLILRLWRKEFYILPLWVVIGGSELFRFLGGLAFYRAHTDPTFHFKIASSFPSEHAVLGAAFYGFLIYLFTRNSKTWRRKTNIIFLGLMVVLGMGFSALYLGEGFLSDVWGGYLLGILWLLIGISLAELLKARETVSAETAPAANAGIFSAVLLAAWLVFYAGFSLVYRPAAKAIVENEIPVEITAVADVIGGGELPAFSQKIFGESSQPLNFAIIAKGDEALIAAMNKAGWILADEVGVRTLLRTLKAEILNENYPAAPMTPSFWNAEVNDFGFEKPMTAPDTSSRHHLRVWNTRFKTSRGLVYVGTARLDTAKWILVHKSSPYIDVERELLFSDLAAAGVVAESRKLPFTEPIMESENLSETPFLTDGEIYEVILK